MGKAHNLTGQIFNYLTVLQDSGKRDASGSILWECQCNCGNTTLATSTALKSGHKKSCGCYQKIAAAQVGKGNAIDLLDKKFGLLTVIQRGQTTISPSGARRLHWICKCECGSEVEIASQALLQENTRSCGCVKSFGERKIAELLSDAGIPYEREKTFEDGLTEHQRKMRFDFYVDNKYIIEYDGKQHFQNTSWGEFQKSQERDNSKNLFCNSHNIPIIRIPYTHFTKIELKDLLLETSTFILPLSLDESAVATKPVVPTLPPPVNGGCERCEWNRQCSGYFDNVRCTNFRQEIKDGGYYG